MDILAQTLSQIKQGIILKQNIITLRYSKIILSLVKLLYREGFIRNFKICQETTKNSLSEKKIKVSLAYNQETKSTIQELNLVSKPGNRIYMSVKQLKYLVYQKLHLNVYVISTNFGLISHTNAIKLNVGGEVICKIR